MDGKTRKTMFTAVVILGSVWGLSECVLGVALRSCASTYSGSVMTGAAFFFIAAAWGLTKRASSVGWIILIASLFKMFDAVLLSLPLRNGAVANPIFAFLMSGAAFLFFTALFKKAFLTRRTGQALLGGTAALLFVSLFPFVKYATGIPACVVPGTGIPLSLYYAPLAVSLSLLTVPLGFWVGERVKALEERTAFLGGTAVGRYLVPVVSLAFCLAVAALVR